MNAASNEIRVQTALLQWKQRRQSVHNYVSPDSIVDPYRNKDAFLWRGAASPLGWRETKEGIRIDRARIFIRPTRQPAITYPTTRGEVSLHREPAGHDPVNTRYAAMNEWKPVLRCNESAPGQRWDKTGHHIVLPGWRSQTRVNYEIADLLVGARTRGMSSPGMIVEESWRTRLFIAYRAKSSVNHLVLAYLISQI